MIETLLGSNIAIVGGGRICKAILQTLSSENFGQKSFTILGVTDIDDQSMGLKYAKQLGIFTTNDYRRLFILKDLDSIIELTKDDDLSGNIRRFLQFPENPVKAGWKKMNVQHRTSNKKTKIQ